MLLVFLVLFVRFFFAKSVFILVFLFVFWVLGMGLSRNSVLAVGLDLLFMSINFSALTLFAALNKYISSELGVSENIAWWAAAAYSMGIFAAFFVGHSRFTEEYPRLTVLVAGLLAAIPQFLIPYAFHPGEVVVLRFIQGLVMMAVPIFSAQVGRLFAGARPFALGTILSGIFIGGLVGSSAGWLVAEAVGWRTAYLLFGSLMIIVALLWIAFTPRETLPEHHRVEEVSEKKLSVWRDKFTILWGFTFFPSIWIIFTLAPLINFIVSSAGWGEGTAHLASEVLEASYMAWSIIVGGVAYVVARRSRQTPRGLFNSFARVQAVCFIVAAIGAGIAVIANSPSMLLGSLVLIAVIQGTAPTFWSTPSTAYPRELVTRAGYALGLISNSAALIGPAASIMVSSLSPQGMWVLTIILSAIGAAITVAGMRLRLPVEKYGER